MEDNCKLLSWGQVRKSRFEGNPMSSVGVMLSLRCLCAMQTDIKQKIRYYKSETEEKGQS